MLYKFEEHGFYVQITGFGGVTFERAEAYLKANRKVEQKVWIQFFDADLIATEEHLYFAVLNALAAFRSKTNLSKSLAMETLLYASSQRQIQKSIELVGIKPGMTEAAVAIIGQTPETVEAALKDLTVYFQTEPCVAVLDLTPKKTTQIMQAFNISPQMMEATAKNKEKGSVLVDLIVEQVALLATEL